jgi:hypothetical protein
VAMIVMLFPVSDDEPRLEPAALEALARLGITSVVLLRDGSVAGLVLEGWSFDPRDAPRAAQAVNRTCEPIRTLQPLVHSAIPPFAALRVENGPQIAPRRSRAERK